MAVYVYIYKEKLLTAYAMHIAVYIGRAINGRVLPVLAARLAARYRCAID